jgi:hypothetical protein
MAGRAAPNRERALPAPARILVTGSELKRGAVVTGVFVHDETGETLRLYAERRARPGKTWADSLVRDQESLVPYLPGQYIPKKTVPPQFTVDNAPVISYAYRRR